MEPIATKPENQTSPVGGTPEMGSGVAPTQPRAAVQPQDDPWDLSGISPQAARDYVGALMSMSAVENDGEVRSKMIGYRYPTAGRITDHLRACFQRHNMAITFPGGWRIANGWVHMRMVAIHIDPETGDMTRIPLAQGGMPISGGGDKAHLAAITTLRKALMMTGANMSWQDPSEDAEQRRFAEQYGLATASKKKKPKDEPRSATRKVYPQAEKETVIREGYDQTVNGGKAREAKPDTDVHPKVRVVRDMARTHARALRSDYGYPDMDAIYRVAVGSDDPWPTSPGLMEFIAISSLAAACDEAKNHGRVIPMTHEELLQAYDECDSLPGPFFRNGEQTDYGRQFALEYFRDGRDGNVTHERH